MTTFALGPTTLKPSGRIKPDMEVTREKLRQYSAADIKLELECRKRGVEKPKLIASK